MPSGVIFDFEGLGDLREKLLALGDSVGEAILIPIVADATEQIRARAESLAPSRTGALKRGVKSRIWKAGRGYAKFFIGLDPATYYGWFQEFGLGDKRSGGVSKRTERRHANYQQTKDLQRRGYRSGSGGISKGQAKRLRTLERGGKLQGQRQPNMAAQPFFRPAMGQMRISMEQFILKALAAALEAVAEG